MEKDVCISPGVAGFIIILLIACGTMTGCEHNTLTEPPADPEPTPRFVNVEPTLRSIEDSLFQPTCTTSMCHNSTSRAANLNLGRNRSHTNMVGVPSLQDSTVLRIYPGKPDSSYLIWKLEGHPNMKGRLMPICASDVQCLDTRVIGTIREWIEKGAPDETSEQ